MYGAAKSGDAGTFFSFISPDVVVQEPEFLTYGGTFHGIEGLQNLFGTLAANFDLAGLDFERIVADGDYVCVIARVPLADGSGVFEFIERARIKDGKVTHLRIYVYDPSSLLEASNG